MLGVRATLCDMRTVSHREMRNRSGEILRRVADGETVRVTNLGQVSALIVPPGADALTDLATRGQVRIALRPLSGLLTVPRRKSKMSSEEILADVHGHR